MTKKCFNDLNKERFELEKNLLDSLEPPNEPITEKSNHLSKNIDLAESGEEILNILEKCDREIFTGWEYKKNARTFGLKHDKSILAKISTLATLISKRIKSNSNLKLIFSGCGTSGRLAYLCTQTFNEYFKKKTNVQCDYIIAGNEFALVNSVEYVEDRPEIGAQILKSKLNEYSGEVIFIGITCGLSASFVAGQIDYCLNSTISNDNMRGQLIGCGLICFNLIEMARKTTHINENNETFYDLMIKMKQRELNEPSSYFILNPLIGPEPITGSSRMKSGTTTKLIIDMILTKAIYLSDNDGNNLNDLDELEMIEFYEALLSNVIYSNETKKSLGNLIDFGAECLRNRHNNNSNNKGSINYLSDSERLGFLCCVDASECLPTFGVSKTDIRGFVSAADCQSLSTIDPASKEWSGFIQACQETWSINIINQIDSEFSSPFCLFILIDDNDEDNGDTDQDQVETHSNIPTKKKIEILLKKSNVKVFHLDLSINESRSSENDLNNQNQIIKLDNLSKLVNEATQKINKYFGKCLQELALKLFINGLSTGSHILIGKVYENLMIDVKVSNLKLYWRAIGILNKFISEHRITSQNECEHFLLRSIYQDDSSEFDQAIDKHIETATGKDFIVPIALAMALGGLNYNEANDLVGQSKESVRSCLLKFKKN